MQLVPCEGESRKERRIMTVLNILTSIFIMAALYGMQRHRFQVVMGLAALVIAPAVLGIIDGASGLVHSLAGAGAALLLTIPLSLLGFVSQTDVIVSIALGAILGPVEYAIIFCIATAFLSIQRMFGIESSISVAGAARDVSPYGAGLLAFDEKSALVEIEAMKMLHRDRKEISVPPCAADYPTGECSSERASRASVLPWCAKLAVATLAVLMIGTSM
jgi:hypothetical protein